jgi:hypothetical protein
MVVKGIENGEGRTHRFVDVDGRRKKERVRKRRGRDMESPICL